MIKKVQLIGKIEVCSLPAHLRNIPLNVDVYIDDLRTNTPALSETKGALLVKSRDGTLIDTA